MDLPNVTIRALASELNRECQNARIAKLQAIGKNAFKLKLFGAKANELVLVSNALFIPSHRFTATEEHKGFVEFCKKRLEGKKILEICQAGWDRVIEIKFEEYRLVCELFADGNVLLVNRENTIESALVTEHWKDRALKKGESYRAPASNPVPYEVTEKEFVQKLNSSAKKIVSALLEQFNLFPLICEEAVAKARINKQAFAKEQDPKKLGLLYQTLRGFFESVAQNRGVLPVVWKLDAKEILLPFELPLLAKEKNAALAVETSFSQALSRVLADSKPAETVQSKSQSKRVLQLQKSIENQKSAFEKLDSQIAFNQSAAEKLFEHYAELNNIFSALKKARSQKRSTAETMASLSLAAKAGNSAAQKIVSIDLAKKRVVVEL